MAGEENETGNGELQVESSSPASLTKREILQQKMLRKQEILKKLKGRRNKLHRGNSGGCAPCKARRLAKLKSS